MCQMCTIWHWKKSELGAQRLLRNSKYQSFFSLIINSKIKLKCFFLKFSTLVLYMSFDRFLLAVESRDLSQADKSIIRVSSFSILQNFNFWMIKFTVIPKKLSGTWIDVLINFIVQKFARLKSRHFSQFLWWIE